MATAIAKFENETALPKRGVLGYTQDN